MLLQCSSPHVVSVFGSIVQDTKLLIVMEYLSGGSVLDLMKPNGGKFDEKYIAVILREILYGLDYLHGMGLIHRDIRGNMLKYNIPQLLSRIKEINTEEIINWITKWLCCDSAVRGVLLR